MHKYPDYNPNPSNQDIFLPFLDKMVDYDLNNMYESFHVILQIQLDSQANISLPG